MRSAVSRAVDAVIAWVGPFLSENGVDVIVADTAAWSAFWRQCAVSPQHREWQKVLDGLIGVLDSKARAVESTTADDVELKALVETFANAVRNCDQKMAGVSSGKCGEDEQWKALEVFCAQLGPTVEECRLCLRGLAVRLVDARAQVLATKTVLEADIPFPVLASDTRSTKWVVGYVWPPFTAPWFRDFYHPQKNCQCLPVPEGEVWRSAHFRRLGLVMSLLLCVLACQSVRWSLLLWQKEAQTANRGICKLVMAHARTSWISSTRSWHPLTTRK